MNFRAQGKAGKTPRAGATLPGMAGIADFQDISRLEGEERERAIEQLVSEGREHFGDSAPKQVHDALHHYELSGASTINHIFRHPQLAGSAGELDREARATSQCLMDAMREVPGTASPMRVYRGLDSNAELDVEVGKEWSDPGFVSTSLLESSAQRFADCGERPGTMLHHFLPAGTPAIYLPGAKQVEEDHVDEHEMLLPPGCVWKVLRDTRDEQGTRHIALHLTKVEIPEQAPKLRLRAVIMAELEAARRERERPVLPALAELPASAPLAPAASSHAQTK